MKTSTTSLNSETSKIEALIAQFDAKETELKRIGGKYMGEISKQTGRIGHEIAKSRGGSSNQAVIIGGVVSLATMAVIGAYEIIQSRALEQKRKEFARNNIDGLEKIGYVLQREGKAAINFLNIQENKEILNLDPNTLKGYSPVFKSLVKYQSAVYKLIERDHAFRQYYTHFADWTEREPNPALLTPFVDSDEWLEKRLKNAVATTQRSSSLIYNYSLQGHLLLFLTPNPESSLGKQLERFVLQAAYLFENEFQKSKSLTLYQRFDYISEVKDLFGTSQLKKNIDKKYLNVKRKVSLYKNRYWIALGIISVIAFITIIIFAIIWLLMSVFNTIF